MLLVSFFLFLFLPLSSSSSSSPIFIVICFYLSLYSSPLFNWMCFLFTRSLFIYSFFFFISSFFFLLFFSQIPLAVSVKMNILLFAPALWLVLIHTYGFFLSAIPLFICAGLIPSLQFPFLFFYLNFSFLFFSFLFFSFLSSCPSDPFYSIYYGEFKGLFNSIF